MSLLIALITLVYVIYGDGLYGSPLYEVSSFTIILATSYHNGLFLFLSHRNFSQISLELLGEDDHHSYELYPLFSSHP